MIFIFEVSIDLWIIKYKLYSLFLIMTYFFNFINFLSIKKNKLKS
jgi:hypothetical protein